MHIRRAFMSKAMDKAAEVKPEFAFDSLAMYVKGFTGQVYKVEVSTHNAQVYGMCECPAGQKDIACYHLGQVYGIYLQMVKQTCRKCGDLAKSDLCTKCAQVQMRELGLVG